MPIVAPSLLAADFLNLGQACELLNQSQADWFHLDVMDGRFVPNISYGLPVIEQLRPATGKFFDVHLMILEPWNYFEQFKKAGADLLSIHLEVCPNLHRNLQHIKELGMKAGVAINPHSPVELLTDIIQDVDVVLVMSVNPGFGGQKFIPYTLEKIQRLRNLIRSRNTETLIEVDGGIGLDNASQIVEAGADILVAGSSVFKANDPMAAIAGLKAAGSVEV